MFKHNLKKHIKRGAIKGFSNFERFRMFAGALEVAYAAPPTKRLKEIKAYCESIMRSKYADTDTKLKASVLHSECASQEILKHLLQRYSNMKRQEFREGKA